MHIKFLLLFYSTHLRIIFTTANLVPVDYETLVNSMFVIDLPAQTLGNDSMQNTGIYNELCSIIGLMGFPQSKSTSIWTVLQNYQWSLTERLSLIFNSPLLPSSSSALSKLHEFTTSLKHSSSCYQTKVEYVGSSLSGLTANWIHSFKSAIRSSSVDLQIIFPTKSYAQQNDAGNFQSMFCSPQNAQLLLKSSLLYKCESVDPNHPGIHSKIMSVSCECGQSFVLITSANFSFAAWNPQRNWELGVIIMDQPSNYIYPYQRNPLIPYSKDDEPWCQQNIESE